jgi:hypothetical protein
MIPTDTLDSELFWGTYDLVRSFWMRTLNETDLDITLGNRFC